MDAWFEEEQQVYAHAREVAHLQHKMKGKM